MTHKSKTLIDHNLSSRSNVSGVTEFINYKGYTEITPTGKIKLVAQKLAKK